MNLWGTDVDVGLNQDAFEEEERKKDLLFNPTHGFFQGSKGKLHYRSYLPEGTPKAVIVFQHGIHAHSGISLKLSDDEYTGMGLLSRIMVKAGFAFYAADLLGHGFSEGHRFYIPNGNWKVNRDDYEGFAKFASSQHGDTTPVFIMGESYGANLAIHVARKWQDDPKLAPPNFAGFAVLAPAIIGDLPPKPVVFVLRNVLKPLFPTWTPFFMPHPVSAERIWRDEKVRAELTSDKVEKIGLSAGGRPFCLGTAAGLLSALEESRRKSIPGINVPFCVAHGSHDWAVPIAGTEYLLEHADTPEADRAVRIVDGGYHDLLSEPTKKETAQFLVDWVNERIEKIASSTKN